MAQDLYTEWLGVPPGDRPPNHYALLNLSLFESDPRTIHDAVLKQTARLRRWSLDPDPYRARRVQEILNEVSRAGADLEDPSRKAFYDARLAGRLGVPLPAERYPVLEAVEPETPAEEVQILQLVCPLCGAALASTDTLCPSCTFNLGRAPSGVALQGPGRSPARPGRFASLSTPTKVSLVGGALVAVAGAVAIGLLVFSSSDGRRPRTRERPGPAEARPVRRPAPEPTAPAMPPKRLRTTGPTVADRPPEPPPPRPPTPTPEPVAVRLKPRVANALALLGRCRAVEVQGGGAGSTFVFPLDREADGAVCAFLAAGIVARSALSNRTIAEGLGEALDRMSAVPRVPGSLHLMLFPERSPDVQAVFAALGTPQTRPPAARRYNPWRFREPTGARGLDSLPAVVLRGRTTRGEGTPLVWHRSADGLVFGTVNGKVRVLSVTARLAPNLIIPPESAPPTRPHGTLPSWLEKLREPGNAIPEWRTELERALGPHYWRPPFMPGVGTVGTGRYVGSLVVVPGPQAVPRLPSVSASGALTARESLLRALRMFGTYSHFELTTEPFPLWLREKPPRPSALIAPDDAASVNRFLGYGILARNALARDALVDGLPEALGQMRSLHLGGRPPALTLYLASNSRLSDVSAALPRWYGRVRTRSYRCVLDERPAARGAGAGNRKQCPVVLPVGTVSGPSISPLSWHYWSGGLYLGTVRDRVRVVCVSSSRFLDLLGKDRRSAALPAWAASLSREAVGKRELRFSLEQALGDDFWWRSAPYSTTDRLMSLAVMAGEPVVPDLAGLLGTPPGRPAEPPQPSPPLPPIGRRTRSAPGALDLRNLNIEVVGTRFVKELTAANASYRQPRPDKFRGLLLTVRIRKPRGRALILYTQDFSVHYTYAGTKFDVAPCQGISAFSTRRTANRPLRLSAQCRLSSSTDAAAMRADTVYVDLFFDFFERDTSELHLVVGRPVGAPLKTSGWK